jgi:hypothetical protein
MTDASQRLHEFSDWAAAQKPPRRLALWIVVALLLHAGTFLLFRIAWPPAAPVGISDASLYVLLPGSAEARRLAPFLEAADPALFAPERAHSEPLAKPEMPAYRPSFAAAAPALVPLPDDGARVLPPLVRDFRPVPMPEEARPSIATPPPAGRTQVAFSASLASRAPKDWPEMKFTARPGDPLAPTRFLIAVAPDGRVLHVMKDGPSDVLDDAASQYLARLWFARGPDSRIAWGTATFHWGLDVNRKEPAP